ncbi:SDR family NAD(P)-dependent oxidoreductase [Bacteriovoracaceae bacterium]|nr:SDR family NAD(P)-dependent oxidoreductase [Bacteriovoracaceae bacterium]
MNIFITGGSSGMGLETAKILLRDGHQVGVCSFQPYEQVKEELPTQIKYYQANVCDREKMIEVIHQFTKDAGSLDTIFANAGINHPKQSVPDWEIAERVIDVNIKGVLNTLAPAIDIMKQQKSGHIVTISSISAFSGLPGMSVYGGSKAFVKYFSESLGVDLYQFGIKVTTLAPGFVLTPLTESNSHKMPFMIQQAQAGEEIVKAIYNQKRFHIFPKPFKFLAKLLHFLPRWIYQIIMRKDLLKLRQS